jgi:hypothetical protein
MSTAFRPVGYCNGYGYGYGNGDGYGYGYGSVNNSDRIRRTVYRSEI